MGAVKRFGTEISVHLYSDWWIKLVAVGINSKLAKSLDWLFCQPVVDAPSEWKTYNLINAVYTDGGGVQQTTSLRADEQPIMLIIWITLLDLSSPTVGELDHHPPHTKQTDEKQKLRWIDIWSPAQDCQLPWKTIEISIKLQSHSSRSVGMSDNYANALLIRWCPPVFDIYGGHQYGAVQRDSNNCKARAKKHGWLSFNQLELKCRCTFPRDFLWSTDAFYVFESRWTMQCWPTQMHGYIMLQNGIMPCWAMDSMALLRAKLQNGVISFRNLQIHHRRHVECNWNDASK